MTYNIHGSDTSNQNRDKDIAQLITVEKPDIIYLCEFNRSQHKLLDSLLINDCKYHSNYKSGTNCILYSNVKGLFIEEVPAPCLSRNHSMIVSVNYKIFNDTIRVIGCHFQSSRVDLFHAHQIRRKEADAIIEYMKGSQLRTIIIGDMNEFSSSNSVKTLLNNGYEDAWWNKGCGYGCTFFSGMIRFRLDHILYQPTAFEPQDVNVIYSELSDHYPLCATLNIKLK